MGKSKGNRCAHVPEEPRRFVPPAAHKARPAVLVKLVECIQTYYNAPRKILPSLDLANGSQRQQRSERREGCLLLLGALIHYLDLATLRVGIPSGEGFTGLTREFLAERAGLCTRRVERAMHDLAKARLITLHPHAQRHADGTYTGYGAIRTVTHQLFAVFGLDGWLKYARDRAAAKRRKARIKAMKADAARRDILAGDLLKRPPPAADVASHGNRTVELIRLMDTHPDLSLETLFGLLGRRSQPTHTTTA